MQAEVYLGHLLVGIIEGGDDGSLRFEFVEGYLRMRRRPVLSQYFNDKLRRPLVSAHYLPAFFTNLLPEGPLRRLIADTIGAREHEELRLLARIGEDLPGAVRIRVLGEAVEPRAGESTGMAAKLRFSLAGVQLKFSVAQDDRGLTLPATGRGGDWVLKLPTRDFAELPENEYWTMSWARASGIEVPDFDLFTYADCDGIDARFFPEGSLAFATRRFDRPAKGETRHIEDFAQVNGFHPWDKYDDARPLPERINYETIARQVQVYCGERDLREFVRRLVFVVLSGNSDAHLKNWSLIYHDGRTASLSPAYDLVATVAYPGFGDDLALPFAGSVAFESVSLAGFARLGEALGLDPAALAAWASEDVERIMGTWAELRPTFSAELQYALDRHHRRLRSASSSLLAPSDR